MAQRGLRLGKLPRKLDESGGISPRLVQPSAQRLPGDITAFAMPEPDDIDDGALRGVDAHWLTAPQVEQLTSQIECARVELVKADRCPEPWPGAAAGNRDVDGGGDRVDEMVPGQCRLQANRGRRDSFGDLDEVIVSRGSIRPPIHTPAERDDLPDIAEPVEAPVADASLPCLAVCERVTEVQ